MTLAQAQADILSVRARIAELIPPWKRDWSIKVEPFDQLLVDDTLRQSIYLALGAVVLVLLIACANITNLLLARSATRAKEMALRSALGATADASRRSCWSRAWCSESWVALPGSV